MPKILQNYDAMHTGPRRTDCQSAYLAAMCWVPWHSTA